MTFNTTEDDSYTYFSVQNINFMKKSLVAMLVIISLNVKAQLYTSEELFNKVVLIVGINGSELKDISLQKIPKTFIIGVSTGTYSDKTGGKFAIITPIFHFLDLSDPNKH